MTSFTPGSAESPLAEPTHTTGFCDGDADGDAETEADGDGDGEPLAEELGEALAEAVGEALGEEVAGAVGEGAADSLTDGAGLGAAELVAFGVGLDAAADSAACGLLSRVSEGDGNEPVRAVNSAGGSSTVIGVDVGELVVDGDDDNVGELVGVFEGVAEGLGDSAIVVATHSGGISAGMSHAVSSLAETSSFADSSASIGADSTTAESAVASTASAAHAAGEPAMTTTIETNTERPARTRAEEARGLVIITAGQRSFRRRSTMINRPPIHGKARTCPIGSRNRNEPSSALEQTLK